MLRDGKGADEKTLVFLFVVGILIGEIMLFTSGTPGMGPWATVVSAGLSFGMMLSGAYAFLAMRNMSIIRSRRFLTWSGIICVLVAIPVAIVIALQNDLGEIAAEGTTELLISLVAMYLVGLLVALILAITLVTQAFGSVALVMIALRRVIPWAMTFLRTAGKRSWLVRKLALWGYNVPYALDSLELHKSAVPIGFRKKAFLRAFALVLILDTAFAVYLCLNPTFLQFMPLQELLTLVSILSILVPLLVVWIETYDAMGMKIPGRKEDLVIARNLRSRAMATLVPLGTLLVLVRLAFQSVDMTLFGTFFVAYMISNAIFGAAILFVFYYWFSAGAAKIPDRTEQMA
jgi:hypothetical protein